MSDGHMTENLMWDHKNTQFLVIAEASVAEVAGILHRSTIIIELATIIWPLH